MASERVSPDTMAKAVGALLKWRLSQSEMQKPKLFDEDEEFVYLILTLKKIPETARVNPHKIPLPHSLISPFSEQCLILDDRPNKARVTKAQAQSKIQSKSILVSKILKLSKLASDYPPFEARRKLCDSYDLFFADKSVVLLLSRLLGKQFFKKRKIPVPLDLKKKNWKEQVERACSSTMLFMRTGTCSVVRVANLRMERDEIVENVVAAIDGVVEVVPKKWANVRSFHVKLLESVALPIYQAVPNVRLKIEGVKAEEEEEEEKETPEKKKKKVEGEIHGKKKGRIREVRYMDDIVGNYLVEDEIGSVDYKDGVSGSDDDEKINKKRKKGVLSELSSAKRVKKLVAKGSDKEKKRKGLSANGESGSKFSVKDEESGVKKKKKKKKSKNKDAKVKAKKSKKVA